MILIVACFLTGCSRPSNFAECMLEDMQGVKNAPVFAATYKSCNTRFNNSYKEIQQGSGRGIFSYNNREECVLKNAKNTTFERASSSISIACGCLYNEPDYQGQTCYSYFCKGSNCR